jgi:TATA-binding protein-associated factor Taf7
MPNGEKKGITVRIDADLHAEVSQYLRDHSMTMAEFVSLALDDELHPKNQMKEGNTMANTRTIAVQVPEDLFQRIKDYLQRNNMTQRQFLIGLIEDELERDQTERESQNEAVSDDSEQDEEDAEIDEEADVDGFEDDSDEDEDEDESEDESEGFSMGM